MVARQSTQTDTRLKFPTEISLEDLAEWFRDVPGDVVMDFIIRLDELAADYDFTVALRDRLNAEIAKEDGAFEALAGNPTDKFLRWLVAMDDPNDEDGVRARQTVRLSQIIDRARDLLGEA
jgi:hypothetical protein